MNVELVTDERRPRLVWRGTLEDFIAEHMNDLDPRLHTAILKGDEVGFDIEGRRCWLRRDLGEFGLAPGYLRKGNRKMGSNP